MGDVVADDGAYDVGMEERRLDLVERTECASPETEHLTSIMLKDTELMTPDPASDERGLGASNDEDSEQVVWMKRKDILGLVGCLVFRNSGR
jgi:hypothetical protein